MTHRRRSVSQMNCRIPVGNAPVTCELSREVPQVVHADAHHLGCVAGPLCFCTHYNRKRIRRVMRLYGFWLPASIAGGAGRTRSGSCAPPRMNGGVVTSSCSLLEWGGRARGVCAGLPRSRGAGARGGCAVTPGDGHSGADAARGGASLWRAAAPGADSVAE